MGKETNITTRIEYVQCGRTTANEGAWMISTQISNVN